jgi:hypothetical protein
MDRPTPELPRSPGVRRALRLLASEPLEPLASASELLAHGARRPGELHEALPLSGKAAGWLAREAAASRLDADVLGSLLLEAALVAVDLGGEQLERLDHPPIAGDGRTMSAAEAAYLRTLTIARRSREARPVPAPAAIAVPVRIVWRLFEVDVDEALRAVPSEAAIAWETAALIEGRTLAECVLLCAAQAARPSAARRA